jgi:hypothetical protein
VTERTSLDATPRERRAALAELDPRRHELAELYSRLEALAQASDESVTLAFGYPESGGRKAELENDGAGPGS